MYFCPLCSREPIRQGFASLESLKAHLDLFHCVLSSDQGRARLLSELENRIERLIEPRLNQDQSIAPVHNRFESTGGGLLQKYARDYDLAHAEIEYLKSKFREDAQKWRQELEQEKEKYVGLEKQFQLLLAFLEEASESQRDGKKKMGVFLDQLLGDMERLEEANFQLQERNALPNETVLPQSPVALFNERAIRDGVKTKLAQSKNQHLDSKNSQVDNYVDQSIFSDHIGDVEVGTGDNISFGTAAFDDQDLALILVFQKLDVFDLLQCALVSKTWNKMARNPLVWRTLRIKNRRITNGVLKSLAKWCKETRNLTLENIKTKPVESKYQEKDHEIGSLEDGLEEILRTCNDHLIFFKIATCGPGITDRALWLAACYCKNLKKIVYISDQFPANAPPLWALGASCRLLDTLVMPPLITNAKIWKGLRFDDEALLMIARCFPTTLKTFCAGGREITVVGLKYIAKYCQWLEALELDHCLGVTRRTAKSLCADGLKLLQVLSFTHCEISASALKYFSDQLPQIRSIRVVFNWRDFPSPKHLESFLTECEVQMHTDKTFGRMLRLEEQF